MSTTYNPNTNDIAMTADEIKDCYDRLRQDSDRRERNELIRFALFVVAVVAAIIYGIQ